MNLAVVLIWNLVGGVNLPQYILIIIPLRAHAVVYCLVNILKETSGSWCSVCSSCRATLLNTLLHTAMEMGTEGTMHRRSFVYCMSAMSVCVRGAMFKRMELRVILVLAHKDTVLLNAPNRAEQLLL